MGKPKLFIVFDQLPTLSSGGLIATYRNVVNELNDVFDIQLVSIFAYDKNDVPEFEKLTIHTFSSFKIDNRFFKVFQYLKKRRISVFFQAMASGIWFFAYRPFAKLKSRKLLEGQRVISSSPAAAMFLSKKTTFIQEIHTYYEYFWGSNLIGRMQAKLMAPATLTLFRNKVDAGKGELLFKSTYMYNGFDDSVLLPKEDNPCRKHAALFVGRLEEHKNPLKLIELAKAVHSVDNDFFLDIYGSGLLGDAMQSAIIDADLEGVVQLKGFTDDKSVYAGYSMLWLTSQFEGFGLVIIEAMANGTPTVSVEWGEAVWEIITDGETGFVARDDAEFVSDSLKLLSDENLRVKMGKEAREDFDARFTLEVNKRQWLEILQSVYG